MKEFKQVVNFGCSFAYGNQASEHGVLCGKHRSLATWIAEYYNLTELNLARPGNSNGGIVDTILNWVSTTDQDERESSLLIVGWTSGFRYGFVSYAEMVSNKVRVTKDDITAREAFILGPENAYNYRTDRWDQSWKSSLIDLYETARLSLYRNVITANAIAAQYNLKMYNYHGLDSHWYFKDNDGSNFKYKLNDNIRSLVNFDTFYKFEEFSLQEFANTNAAMYHVSAVDSHPNHVCYKEWSEKICKWLDTRS